MRTVTFKSLMQGVARGMGGANADLTGVKPEQYAEALTLTLRYCWCWADAGWPELKRTDPVTPVDGLIAWDATSRMLGTVHGLYLDDPDSRQHPRPVQDWRWNSQGNGLVVFGTTSQIWVTYTPLTPVWTDEVWASGEYSTGEVVYDPDGTGECYEAIANVTNEALTDTSKWRKLDVPAIFRRAAVRGAVALLSGNEGDRAEEQLLEESMGEVLAQEWRQFTRSTGQHQRVPVSTAY